MDGHIINNVKQEPIEQDYTSFFPPSEVDQGPIIKHESEGVVKTEITVGTQYDDECSVVGSGNQPVVSEQEDQPNINMDCSVAANGLLVQDYSNSFANGSDNNFNEPEFQHDTYGNAPFHNSDVEIGGEENHYSSMKTELPGKYKMLFDGVKAFPEMTKDILPILEELIHFHNCVCLLRKDLNLFRCDDCGKGFVDVRRLRGHKRHCVVQKLENRFAPANISEQTGLSLEPPEPPETPSKGSSENECVVADNEQSRTHVASMPETPKTTVKREKIDVATPPVIRVTHDKDGNMQISKQGPGKRRRERKREKNDYELGTSWGSVTKTECSKIPKVVEINQFNHRTIYPYHVFRYSGEVVYHSPIAISYKDEFGTAQNVFNTMICSIAEVGRLVPSLKGRSSYSQVRQKLRTEVQPDLELLPSPSPKKPSHMKSGKLKLNVVPSEKKTLNKIKIVCPSSSSSKDDSKFTYDSNPISRLHSGPQNRRTKTIVAKLPPNFSPMSAVFNHPIKSVPNVVAVNAKPEKNTASSQKSCYNFNFEYQTEFPDGHDRDKNLRAIQNITDYMNEPSCINDYALDEADKQFLHTCILKNSKIRRYTYVQIEKMLSRFQNTIPNGNKRTIILKTRGHLDNILSEPCYEKKYDVSTADSNFIETFMFGIANPTYRQIDRAKYLVTSLHAKKIRFDLKQFLVSEKIHKLDFSSRLFLDDFVVKQVPEIPHVDQINRANNLLDFFKNANSDAKIEESNDTAELHCVKEVFDEDLSSPEIMRSCPEDANSAKFIASKGYLPLPPESPLPVISESNILPNNEKGDLIPHNTENKTLPTKDAKLSRKLVEGVPVNAILAEEVNDTVKKDEHMQENDGSITSNIIPTGQKPIKSSQYAPCEQPLALDVTQNMPFKDTSLPKDFSEISLDVPQANVNCLSNIQCINIEKPDPLSLGVLQIQNTDIEESSSSVSCEIRDASCFKGNDELTDKEGIIKEKLKEIDNTVNVDKPSPSDDSKLKKSDNLSSFNDLLKTYENKSYNSLPKKLQLTEKGGHVFNHEYLDESFIYFRDHYVTDKSCLTKLEIITPLHKLLIIILSALCDRQLRHSLHDITQLYLCRYIFQNMWKLKNMRLDCNNFEDVLFMCTKLKDIHIIIKNGQTLSAPFLYKDYRHIAAGLIAMIKFCLGDKVFLSMLTHAETYFLNQFTEGRFSREDALTIYLGVSKKAVFQNRIAHIHNSRGIELNKLILHRFGVSQKLNKQEYFISSIAKNIKYSGRPIGDSCNGLNVLKIKSKNDSNRNKRNGEPQSKQSIELVSTLNDMFDIYEVDSPITSPSENLPEEVKTINEDNEKCDIQVTLCASQTCSKNKIEFGHPRVLAHALGPFFTLCQKHYTEIGKNLSSGEITRITVKDTNKVCRYLEEKLTEFKKTRASSTTQTEDTPEGFHTSLFECKAQADNIKKTLIDENIEAKSKIEALQQQLNNQTAAMSDLEQQLKAERALRRVLKAETDTLSEANKQFTPVKIEIGDAELQQRFEKLRKENDKLKENNSKLEKDLKSLQTSETGLLTSSLERLQEEKVALAASNAALQQSLEEKKSEIKSLEVSMQSVSEALRHQTKTISSLSRKTPGTTPTEQHNHRVYSGYESLLAITCKVLGAKLETDGQKIEDPSKMRQICENIAGEDNLFAIFMRLFCSNSVCADERDTMCIEKRVLFLVNLITYFYNAPKEGDDNEPSSSKLQELL